MNILAFILLTFVSLVSIAEPIKLETQLKKALRNLQNSALELSRLDLARSPGPIIEVSSKPGFTSFRYLEVKNQVTFNCSGLKPGQSSAAGDYWKASANKSSSSSRTFLAANHPNYCFSYESNGAVENLLQQIVNQHRVIVVQQLATVSSHELVEEILNKIDNSELNSKLNSISIELTGYDSQTTESQMAVKMELTQSRGFGVSQKRICRGLLSYRIRSNGTRSEPTIQLNTLSCAPGF